MTMPVSVERFGDVYVAASDEDDWFGTDVVVRTADAPQGPWREAMRYTPDTKCERCNNYGAFVLPRLEDGKVVIAHSNNAWDMESDAFTDASRYRISVNALSVPGVPRNRSVRALIEADQTTRGQVEATGRGARRETGHDRCRAAPSTTPATRFSSPAADSSSA